MEACNVLKAHVYARCSPLVQATVLGDAGTAGGLACRPRLVARRTAAAIGQALASGTFSLSDSGAATAAAASAACFRHGT